MTRPRHSKKDIEAIMVYARQLRRVVDNCTGGTSSKEDET